MDLRNFSHLFDYSLDMAPDHGSGEGPGRGYLGSILLGPITLNNVVGTWCGYRSWRFITRICITMRWSGRPTMLLATGLQDSTPYSPRLFGRTNHLI